MNAQDFLSELATTTSFATRDIPVSKGKVTALFNTELTDAVGIREVFKSVKEANKYKLCEIKDILAATEVKLVSEKAECMEALLSGDLLLFSNEDSALIVSARKYEKRAVAEPPTETVMRGPREGFIEELKTNIGLLQRRLRTPALGVEKMRIGRVGSTMVAMVYISTIADPKLVGEVRRRLKAINIDCLLDSHYLQPLIEDHPFSIFQQSGVSEKPDVVCAKLLEGRVALIVEGSPTVMTVPFLFMEDLQNSEDYYERNAFASFLRILRLVALFIGIMLPGFYVALQMFHQEVIPVRFLNTLMNAIESIPLPPLSELLFVLLLFEIIRESSVRMPRAVGMAMSIVGALVLGETAVNAGMISSPAVMVVALSSIALYTVPNDVGTMSLLRIVFILAGGLFGFYGLMLAAIFVAYNLVSLDSFGVSYTAPFVPYVSCDFHDALVRDPLSTLKKRPKSIPNINSTRQGD